ncbi:MAG: hypothetical protein IAG10_06990 [Planctomycetaceae bacterium]|nr:hypothetical protein [Planctomycetaceae bacterium]
MSYKVTCGLSLMLIACNFIAVNASQDIAAAPAAQYQKLLDEYEGGAKAPELAARFFELAEQHASDLVAVDSLVWVLTKLRIRPEAARALELLERDHLHNEQFAAACRHVARTPSVAAEKLLRKALEKSKNEKVRGQACRQLAFLLDQQASVVDQLKKKPESADRVMQFYGAEYGKHLKSLDREQLEKKREQHYELMLKSFADVKTSDGTLGEIAEKALFRIRHLSIGRVAPEIDGEDIFGKTFKLSDHRGKVVVLSFWGHW